MLIAKRRIRLDRDTLVWLEQALGLPGVELLPISPEIAIQAITFPENFRGDPADRLIAATTLVYHSMLITKDERLHGYQPLPTLW